MEYVIRFAISLFDLAVFMYYFHSNKKMKPVSKVWIWAGFTIAAVIWTFVSSIKNPYLNLATLLIVLILLSFYYESGMWTRIINIVTFMGIGMLFEPVALLLLHAMNFHVGESYKYYFVMVICSFVRGKRVRTKFWTTIGLRKEPFYVFKRTKGYCTTDISSNRVCN